MFKSLLRNPRAVLIGCVALLAPAAARAATVYQFDVNGTTSGSGVTNGGTYNWSDPAGFWNTDTTGVAQPVVWPTGTANDAQFSAGTDGNATFTVTIGSTNESVKNVNVLLGNVTIGAAGDTGHFSLTASDTWSAVPGTSLIVNDNISQSSRTLFTDTNSPTISGPDGFVTFNGVLSSTTGGIVRRGGNGTVTLTGNNTYAGTTLIQGHNGTLLIDGVQSNGGNYSFDPGTNFDANASGTIGGTGTAGMAAGKTFTAAGPSITQFAIVAPGDPSKNGGIGTFTIGSTGATNTTTIGDNAKLAIDVNGLSSDLLAVNGNLTLTGTNDILAINDLGNGSFDGIDSYTIATYTGTLTGTFASTTGLPSGYRVDYGTTVPNAITLDPAVPEPASLGLIALGALGFFRRRRGH